MSAGDEAFGAPGVAPTWTSSAKDVVTTALGPSRLWATLGYGIVNEVYWPSTGRPQLRDLGFIVAGDSTWTELKRARNYQLHLPAPYVPLPTVVHEGEGYRLELEYLPDPLRDVLLIRYHLEADGLRLYPLLAPHLGGSGWNNTAWVGDGLFASKGEGRAMCLVSHVPFARASAGYVGASDGWQDFARHGRMTYTFGWAADGNVALIGELEPPEGVLTLGLARTPEGAAVLARSSLDEGYGMVRAGFLSGWEGWGKKLQLPSPSPEVGWEAKLSAAVLKVHEDKTYPGSVVASLSIPWGNTSNAPGGYHRVWTRDAVEAGLALTAAAQVEDARRVLAFLIATQDDDGHWAQSFFPDGRASWTGVQLDEVGLPVLLAAKLAELQAPGVAGTEEMVRRAATYLARHGPVTPQDRWEENAGLSPFTLAVEVAALSTASEWLAGAERDYALGLADCWNERVEEWTLARDTPLARRHGVAGYYVRIAPPAGQGGVDGLVPVRNRAGLTLPAHALVGLDFLCLVRLGLRRADDPWVQATLAVVEALLCVGTPSGPGYHRYNQDGYGEHADGRPFDGTGVGRLWPLLTGERGHLALEAGEDSLPYLEAMARMTGRGGLIPEQVWDDDPIPERGLEPGKPTGSAMPLVWAHAEFLRLVMARERRRPVERVERVWSRYRGSRPEAPNWYWRQEVPVSVLPAGRALVIEERRPFVLHLGMDGWRQVHDRQSAYLGLGMHGVRLQASELAGHHTLEFTRRSPDGRWEGLDHRVELGGGAPP